MPSSTESVCRRLQIGIPDVGLSIVNDIIREEILYISLKKSKVIWAQVKKSRLKPFSQTIHTHLEELYRTNLELIDAYPDDEILRQTKYTMNEYRVGFLLLYYLFCKILFTVKRKFPLMVILPN
jgi:hypothetical protein